MVSWPHSFSRCHLVPVCPRPGKTQRGGRLCKGRAFQRTDRFNKKGSGKWALLDCSIFVSGLRFTRISGREVVFSSCWDFRCVRFILSSSSSKASQRAQTSVHASLFSTYARFTSGFSSVVSSLLVEVVRMWPFLASALSTSLKRCWHWNFRAWFRSP